jgi:uncharacterized protein YqfB (UPF0267 family)
MNQQEALNWAKDQDIIKISPIKVNEEDKYIFTLGKYNVSPIVFDSREESEKFLQENFNLNNFELSVIGAMYSQLRDIILQEELKNSKNEEK